MHHILQCIQVEFAYYFCLHITTPEPLVGAVTCFGRKAVRGFLLISLPSEVGTNGRQMPVSPDCSEST